MIDEWEEIADQVRYTVSQCQKEFDKIYDKITNTTRAIPSQIQSNKLQQINKQIKEAVKIPTKTQIKKILNAPGYDGEDRRTTLMDYLDEFKDFMPQSTLLYLFLEDTSSISTKFKNYLLSILYASKNIQELNGQVYEHRKEIMNSFEDKDYAIIPFTYYEDLRFYNLDEKEMLSMMNEILNSIPYPSNGNENPESSILAIIPFEFVANISKKVVKQSQKIIIDSLHLA